MKQHSSGAATRYHAIGKLVQVFLSLILVTGVLFGQATDSNIVGSVTDATGAAIPNATITATNRDTRVEYTGASNSSGEYRINNVPIGTYDVDAKAASMAPSKVSGLVLSLNRTSAVNFTMQVASASRTVNVTEATTTID